MTVELRRLVALAVILAPARAVGLLGRLGGPGRAEAVRLAEGLASAPRRARLAELAAALPEPGPASTALPGPGGGAHRMLQRLERERSGRPVAGRTLARAADGPAG